MNILELQQCANCGACYNACPRDAITVKEEETFYKLHVDNDRCIDCSLCVRVCPVNLSMEGNRPIAARAGWNRDDSVVLKSSSGGVFYGLAHRVIEDGGIVFSAVYSDDCRKVELASSDDVPLASMMKSKYVESLVGFSFRQIRDELEKGRRVLFCGTPCQVAGLNNYLAKDYEHLITCDFACGGLPSHKMFREYLEILENKYGAAVQEVDFRPKTYGWKRHALRVRFQNGKEQIRLGTEDPYLRSFLYGKYTIRDYCLDCKFPECHVSDITIADFWLHESLSSLKHEDGISLILCNTRKGIYAIDLIGEQFVITELDVETASYNNQVQISERKKEKHEAFLDHYIKNGFAATCKAFLPDSPKSRLKHWVIRTVYRKKRKLL